MALESRRFAADALRGQLNLPNGSGLAAAAIRATGMARRGGWLPLAGVQVSAVQVSARMRQK